MIVCIKNYHKNKNSSLTARSVRHFLPDSKIYLFNIYETLTRDELDIDVFDGVFDFEAKYSGKTWGTGAGSPSNGLYFTEGINHVFNKFSDTDEKVLILDEDHFFTTGATLRELEENDYDFAWAYWFAPEPHELDMSASILSFRPNKVSQVFPIPERVQFIETLLRIELHEKLIGNCKIHKITTRIHGDYKGDGEFTNDASFIASKLRNAGIAYK